METVQTGNAGKLALLPTQHQKESILLKASSGHYCTPVSASLHDSCCLLNTSHAPLSAIHASHHYVVILTVGGSCFLLLYPLYRWKKWNPRHNIAGPVTPATGFKALISYCSLGLAPGLTVRTVLVPVVMVFLRDLRQIYLLPSKHRTGPWTPGLF